VADRLRIAQVVPTYLPLLGGKESYVWNAVEHLPEFDFEVLTARVPGLPAPPVGPQVRVHRFRPAESFRGPWAFPAAGPAVTVWGFLSLLRLRRQRRRSEALGCAVVHSHWSDVEAVRALRGRVSPTTWDRVLAKVLAAARFRQPTVFTDHSMLVQEMPDLYRRLLEHALREYRLVLAVEPEGGDRAKALRDASRGTAEVAYLPNSVDTEALRPRPDDRRPSVIAYLGRANKAHWLVRELSLHLPEYRFLFGIAGYGRSMEKWRAMRSERVDVRENVGPMELPSFLAHADLVVNPLLVHGMGRVTLEAFAAGLPVIGDLGASRYPLVHGRTGLLTEPDPKAFASAVRDLMGNPPLLRDFGREGRRIVEREFSNDVVLPRLASWYRRLAA